MTRTRVLTLVLLGVVVVAVGGVAVHLGPIAPIATGYAAKITCSGHLLAERPLADAATDLPDNPLVPFLRTRVDRSAGTVSTSLLGLWDSTAWYTPGLGCTLARSDPAFAPVEPAGGPTTTRSDAPWPDSNLVDEQQARAAVGADGPALDAAVAGAFAEDDAAGRRKNTRAVVVVEDGRVVAERYADGIDADTELLGWSMGKSIANAMVGRLVRQDRLSLDDADLRTAWADDRRAGITLEHLLHMTSGLAFEEVYAPDTDATTMLFTPGSTADFAAARPLVEDPGTTWSYSSGSSNIVCDEAQAAAGMGVEMARELVFDPLGMSSAVMEPDASGGLVCSSFVYMTALDWARFGQWFLEGGNWQGSQLLPDDWIEVSTTPVEVGTEHPYGAHWWLNEGADGDLRMPSVPADAYWASGNEGQQVVVVPSEDLVVVRLGFTSDFSGIEWGLESLVAEAVAATP